MSAALCGSKRSYFDDLPASASPPLSKRLRCSSSSPVQSSVQSVLDHLRAVFPRIDAQALERALEECQNDLDATVRQLNKHCLGSVSEHSGSAEGVDANLEKDSLPVSGPEWVELFVREMLSATSLEDARVRASRGLEVLEKSVSACIGAEAEEQIKENKMLKEQIEVSIEENSILKRAVAIQYERQEAYEERNQEILDLRQQLSQSQERMRKLEMDHYALAMLLRQAQQSCCVPRHFNPDVF